MKFSNVNYKNGLFFLSFLLIFTSCHKKEERPTVQPPVKVAVMQVGPAADFSQKVYSGTVSSSSRSTVSFSVAGTITELYASEGQKVTKGQVLGKVKNGDYQNAYNIAEAQLKEAQDGYNRLKKLHDANALPDVKWVEMEQKLQQAQNSAEIAKRALDDAILRSPVSGTVTRKFANVGQTVMPVEPVYEIISTSDITIDINVSENEIGNFRAGQKAMVQVDALGPGPFEGTVKQKSVVADPLTRSFTVKVAIPNKDGKILPGMIGNVAFEKDLPADTLSNGFVLPSQAVLLNDDNRWFVWIVKDSVAQRKFVTVDELAAHGVIVKEGLEVGDKVIIEGMQKVGGGTVVITVD